MLFEIVLLYFAGTIDAIMIMSGIAMASMRKLAVFKRDVRMKYNNIKI
ncbi:hypothetical protein DFE_2845 [Desulfovibrio ferrophilus]|uniref:Uncharacterized protein n=1 Tax=Desulfovibrio ferrophilus TaxID=241368 RepID=A0A2Z6B270_9BACT|nr:hypothetical protein DFE_2845 [Desulfovibrio ferrophilus]